MLLRLFIPLWRRLGRLPLAWLHRIGRVIGYLYWRLPNRERRTIRINLALCFPEWSEARREALCRETLRQMGCNLMELSAIWFRPPAEVGRLVRRVSGEEHLRRKPGQGVILLAPHLGCWEIIGVVLPEREIVTSLYRPPRKAELEALIKQARERSGSTLVPTDNQGVRRLYQALQQGGATCILPDQQPQSSRAAVFAPFFGQPALTMLLIQRLVKKTGAKVIVTYAERLPRGEGYHIHYLPAPPGLDDDDPERAAEHLNRGLEQAIRDCPEQYQWAYKRFRAQPDGRPSPYRRKG